MISMSTADRREDDATCRGNVTVVLDAAERDALWHEVDLTLHCDMGEFDHVGRDHVKAQRMRRAIELEFRMLDELGWDQDDERDTYTLTVDDGVVEWIRCCRPLVIECIDDECYHLAEVRTGDPRHRHEGWTVEESEVATKQGIDHSLEVLYALDRVLRHAKAT
jgi:hypothetical protein